MNNDNFLVEQEDIEKAQKLCCIIRDSKLRSRAVANALAARIALKYFQDVEVDIESGLYKIPKVAEDIEISDIYINGNYIDVRLYFNDDEIFVPKSHFESDIVPAAYMFVKLEQDLSSARVMGFVFPDEVDTSAESEGYYKIDEKDFVSFYDVEARLSNMDDAEVPEGFEKDIFDYLDGKLANKKAFFRTLIKSGYARETLYSAESVKIYLSELDYDSDKQISDVVSEEEEAAIDTDTGIDSLDNLAAVDDLTLDSAAEEIVPLDDFSDDLLTEMPADSDVMLADEGDGLVIDEQAGGDLLSEETVDLLEEDTQEDTLSDFAGDAEEQVSDNNIDEDVLTVSDENTEADIITEVDVDGTTDVSADENVDDSGFDLSYTDEDDYGETPESEIQDYVPEATGQDIEGEEPADEFAELSEFDYSTEVTPSIASIEAEGEEAEEEIIPQDESENIADDSESAEINDGQPHEAAERQEESQIETLFTEDYANGVANPEPKKKGCLLPLLGILVVIAAAGYFGYNKFVVQADIPEVPAENYNLNQPEQRALEKKETPAMPVETVEEVPAPKVTNEGTSASIPAIEQNLGAAIQVSNLSVNWEVPASYTTNTTAKRYFVRIGKILQLNLKTELLLMSTPPITNKVSLELEFNKATNKFMVKEFINSSGVKGIDDVIKSTTEKTLGTNLNMNMSVFNNLQGNPVLVIKL